MEDPVSDDLKEKLSRVSKGPGVYLMKDADGVIIYVGKARNLKSRLSSYFIGPRHTDVKTSVLLGKIVSFDTILTATEQEALILESNLIKRYRPRYNVILKDDKRYPVLRLDATHPFPNLTVARKIVKDGALYFGPFSSAKAVRETLKLVNKTFQLRKCGKTKFTHRTRPCLHCQMGQCLGPCCLDIGAETYADIVREVTLFLSGRAPDLIRKIKQEMMAAAEVQEYERAAKLRDKLFSLQHITEKQVVVTHDFKDRDVVGLVRYGDGALITVLNIRNGYLIGYRHFELRETIAEDDEILSGFVRQYYEQSQRVPEELLLPIEIEDAGLLMEWLVETKGKRIQILFPKRGEKVKLIDMARQNAENHLKELHSAAAIDQDLLLRLQRRLSLRALPIRIECFDNSNTYGTNPVSGMVVFENGKPKKSDYRTYKIRSLTTPDDYASMAEVLGRRFDRAEAEMPFPDLLMVDGGRGQLNIALSVLDTLGVDQRMDVLGIAKKDEKKGETQDKIYLPGRVNPIHFGKETDLLLFLQRVRDESHRFALSFHRRQRRTRALQSKLTAIPGIGNKRREALLAHFGSIRKIREASIEELMAVPGISRSTAEAIKNPADQN